MKRLSMLKLLTIASLLSTSLFGNSELEKKLLTYEKQRISGNPQAKLKDVKLAFSKNLENGWRGYLFNLSLTYQGKNINTNDILFSNGTMVTSELKKITGFDYKRAMHPTLSSKYHDPKRLIAGDPKAPNKIVIFSDPLCPNCTDFVPEVIEDVKKNSKTHALYYVAFPLDMHPTAKALSKAAMILEEKGQKDVTYKLYKGNFEKYFDPYESKDEQKALQVFNQIFRSNITLKDINDPKITALLAEDMRLADEAYVMGTPTLFYNGEIDVTRSLYKQKMK